MRLVFRLMGGAAVVAGSFFATLWLIDYYSPTPSELRLRNAQAIMDALEKFRFHNRSYPVLPVVDSVVQELSKPLVGGGFISAIPPDPAGSTAMRYVSLDGKSFGMLVTFENGSKCLIEVKISNSGFWGQPPPCRL